MAKQRGHVRRPVKRKPATGSGDKAQRKKYAQGGRIEAYTFGEALKKDKWP